MIIDKSNSELINSRKINLHDDILESVVFSREEKEMQLNFLKYPNNLEHSECSNKYTMLFKGVIGFSMTSCDFWGASECLFDFEYVLPTERILIPDMKKIWSVTPNAPDDISYEDYMEVLFTFSSGDYLRIACKTIDVLSIHS